MLVNQMNQKREEFLNLSQLPTRTLCNKDKRTVIALVGLPARGKTFICRKLTRYLNWIGINTRVFNVGDYRRKAKCPMTQKFFSDQNEVAAIIRKKAAADALTDSTEWLANGGEIVLFDATNTTRDRREMICKHCQDHKVKVLFIESICDNQDVIDTNIMEVKVNCPDYLGVDKNIAMHDFLQRIEHYESRYEPIDDDLDRELPYIKIFNQGQRYLVNRITGNMNNRIVHYLMNINVEKRTIYLVRHGESEFNLLGKIGGDSELSANGKEFAKKLGHFMDSEGISDSLNVWTSHMRRTIQTAEHIKCAHLEQWKALDEIHGGICDGMTYDEIKDQYPYDFSRRDQDKFHFRYQMGESYEDLVSRLEPVIMELERQQNVLVVCHQAVARCLLAYFQGVDRAELPHMKVLPHTIFKLKPKAYSCDIDTVTLDVPSVNTHRSKPEVNPG